MKTKTNKKTNKKKTRKNIKINPSVKPLKKGFSLYASKSFSGDQILSYTQTNEEKYKKPCLLDNLSWFGSYEVAKSYQTKETHLYQWILKKKCELLRINKENDAYFRQLFLQSQIPLDPLLHFSLKERKAMKTLSLDSKHPYITMNEKERA